MSPPHGDEASAVPQRAAAFQVRVLAPCNVRSSVRAISRAPATGRGARPTRLPQNAAQSEGHNTSGLEHFVGAMSRRVGTRCWIRPSAVPPLPFQREKTC
jgi:hypothetical protein